MRQRNGRTPTYRYSLLCRREGLKISIYIAVHRDIQRDIYIFTYMSNMFMISWSIRHIHINLIYTYTTYICVYTLSPAKKPTSSWIRYFCSKLTYCSGFWLPDNAFDYFLLKGAEKSFLQQRPCWTKQSCLSCLQVDFEHEDDDESISGALNFASGFVNICLGKKSRQSKNGGKKCVIKSSDSCLD